MTDAPHRTVFTLEYDEPRIARIIERSLAEEVGQIDDARAKTALSRQQNIVTITVDAADLVALRAAVNTWLSLVSVAEEVGESIDF